MKGCNVIVWHPESPGSRLTVWRPWWRRKRAPFATVGEAIRAWRQSAPPRIDVTRRPSRMV